jgi:hypothetical protein
VDGVDKVDAVDGCGHSHRQCPEFKDVYSVY